MPHWRKALVACGDRKALDPAQKNGNFSVLIASEQFSAHISMIFLMGMCYYDARIQFEEYVRISYNMNNLHSWQDQHRHDIILKTHWWRKLPLSVSARLLAAYPCPNTASPYTTIWRKHSRPYRYCHCNSSPDWTKSWQACGCQSSRASSVEIAVCVVALSPNNCQFAPAGLDGSEHYLICPSGPCCFGY